MARAFEIFPLPQDIAAVFPDQSQFDEWHSAGKEMVPPIECQYYVQYALLVFSTAREVGVYNGSWRGALVLVVV